VQLWIWVWSEARVGGERDIVRKWSPRAGNASRHGERRLGHTVAG
jgi:hypothetical protein